MNRRTSSALAFGCSVAVATLAATLMAGNALADDITVDTTPFHSQLTRAQVQAELFANRDSFGIGSAEIGYQPQPVGGAYTRDQARADYIAARDEVHAMTGEDSGSALLSQERAHQRSSSVAMAPQH